MFYGSGAGKLPTASAVVADVVDLIKHKHTNIDMKWAPEKVKLLDYREGENSFFVRTTSDRKKVEDVFGKVTFLEAVVPGEVAFTTASMKEAEFEEKASKLAVVNRIRLA